MESIAVIFMLAAGGAIALFVTVAMAIARRESGPQGAPAVPERSRIASSLLYQVLSSDGNATGEVLREMRQVGVVAVPPGGTIDVVSWGERFAQLARREECDRLLESAVVLLAARRRPVPLLQYVALLDLSFALGFRTDALAKLRERHPFDYIDHAKASRPHDADRSGRSTLYVRDSLRESELLAILELDGTPRRQEIIAAYRRLAARHHPDRFHGADTDELEAAAARFIEVTRAYEALLALHRE